MQHATEPDILTPLPQAGRARRIVAQGATELMRAVLKQAIAEALGCYREPGKGGVALRAHKERKDEHSQQAQRWFTEPPAGWLFDFENVCAVLELSPNRLRRDVATLSLLFWLSQWPGKVEPPPGQLCADVLATTACSDIAWQEILYR